MSEQAIEKLLEALSPLAEKLGESATFVFRAAVRESIITGVSDLVWAFLFISVGLTAWFVGRQFRKVEYQRVEESKRDYEDRYEDYKNAKRAYSRELKQADAGSYQAIGYLRNPPRKPTEPKPDEDVLFVTYGVGGSILALFGGAGLNLIINAAHHFFNPEYQAIRMLLSEVTG